ncbi:RdgB/HAM1 family non-canonical purine NTP pyrophosphatase [bacterium]|nr:RdgB/HAM1 family non-canonical purine NTP pyrophosphatase [bacterium]
MSERKKIVLVVATRNQHKLSEIKKIVRGSGISVKPLSEFSGLSEVVENGKTLEINAIKKAQTVTRALKLPVLADDSGLFVPALDGEPGVKSARYAGPSCDYAANNKKLLKRMKHLEGKDRCAYFATTMVLAKPDGTLEARTGKIWGQILETPIGKNGFGYDPVFQPWGQEKTFAQMSAAQKNLISHRALAMQKISPVIRRKMQ